MMNRRQLLVTGAALSVGLAGCLEDTTEDDDNGGVSFRASLLGQTATGLDIDSERVTELEPTIATELGSDPIDIAVLPSERAVEARLDGVSAADFTSALSTAGLAVDSGAVRPGVTEQTAAQARETVRNRVERASLSGVDVTVSSEDGPPTLLIDADKENYEQISELLAVQSPVQVMLATPNDQPDATEPETEVLLEANDFLRISDPQPAGNAVPQPHVTVQLTADAATRFQRRLVDSGFTEAGVTGSQACRWTAGEGLDPNQYCLSTVLDGEVVNAAGINPGLANNLEAGAFDGGYLITASSFDEARELSRELRSGSLPTPVELERVDD